MQFGVDTWTDVITERIGRQMIDANLLPENAILGYVGDIDDILAAPPGDRFVVVAPMNLPVNILQTSGGGDEWAAFDAVFRVDICMRVMERENRTSRILSDSSKSLATLVKNVLKVLHVKPLTLTTAIANGDEQSPLRQPMRLVSATYNPRKPASGWAYCRTIWQTYFRADLSV